jgi:hypothetical protein
MKPEQCVITAKYWTFTASERYSAKPKYAVEDIGKWKLVEREHGWNFTLTGVVVELFLLELTTGVRRGQICGPKWSDVDLSASEITVHDNRVVVGGMPGIRPAARPTMPTRQCRSTVPPSPHCADGVCTKTASASSSAPTITLGTMYSPSKMADHHIRTRSGSDSTVWQPPRAGHESPFTICATRTRPVRSKLASARR